MHVFFFIYLLYYFIIYIYIILYFMYIYLFIHIIISKKNIVKIYKIEIFNMKQKNFIYLE